MNDHDHYGEYAEERHRHYDLERDGEAAQRDIRRLQEDVRELRSLLDNALDQIRELGSADMRLAAALRKAAAGHEETRSTGLADETHLTIAAGLAGAFTVFADCMDEPEHGPAAMQRFMREHPLTPVREPDGEPDDGPDPEEYDPGPECDDEGGMSEYRYVLPEDYERGQS